MYIYIKREGLQLQHLWFLNQRVQITQETREESYYRRNPGQVRCINTMDKTTEPQGTAALSGLLSYFPIYISPLVWTGLHMYSPSCLHPETPPQARVFPVEQALVACLSLTMEDSTSEIAMVENANTGKKRLLSSPDALLLSNRREERFITCTKCAR